jgi:RNA polymerase sigma-70 factor (ECF subfamily)
VDRSRHALRFADAPGWAPVTALPSHRTWPDVRVDPCQLARLRQLVLAAAEMEGRTPGAFRQSPAALSHTSVATPRSADHDADTGPPPEAAPMMSLVERAQQGDADAFGELYDRYVDLVYRYVYYRVGMTALAEDLTSETFLRALRRIGTFTWQGRDFGAWLITISRNLVADHYKSGRFRLEVATADLLEAGADRRQEGPEDAVLESIANAELLEAVRQLNPEQQECVVLRFLQGLSVAETALAMGKNEGAIKALQYRAVRTLGRLLPAEAVR